MWCLASISKTVRCRKCPDEREADPSAAITLEGKLAYKIARALFGQLNHPQCSGSGWKFYEVFHIYGYEDDETSGAICALWSSATFVV